MNFLSDFILEHVIKLSFLDGYRSYLAGSGILLSGAALLLNQVAGGVYDHDTVEKGIAAILAGMAVIGHAGKQEKIAAATKGK